MGLADIVSKAKGWAAKNPDKARQAIDKVEHAVDSKTGGKYKDQIDKAGQAVGGKLGVPTEGQQGGQSGQVPQGGQQGQTPPADNPGQQTPPGGQAG